MSEFVVLSDFADVCVSNIEGSTPQTKVQMRAQVAAEAVANFERVCDIGSDEQVLTAAKTAIVALKAKYTD